MPYTALSATPIAGTRLVALSREGANGYDVGLARLPTTGVGDVTVNGAMYHIWNVNGALMGARFDAPIESDTIQLIHDLEGLSLMLSSDDLGVVGNETGTTLLVSGEVPMTFSVGDLLATGSAQYSGINFVSEALETVQKERKDIAALLGLESSVAGLDIILDLKWRTVAEELKTAFGKEVLGERPEGAELPGSLDAVTDALSVSAAFAAASAEDSDGVFASLALDEQEAIEAFEATASPATAVLGAVGPTRFGAIAQRTRGHALLDFTDVANRKIIVLVRHMLGGNPDSSGLERLNADGSSSYLGEVASSYVSHRRFEEAYGSPLAIDYSAWSAASEDGRTDLVTAAIQGQEGDVCLACTVTRDATNAEEVYQIDSGGTSIATIRAMEVTFDWAGTLGAFAYSVDSQAGRTRFVQTSGNAYYRGGTKAVSGDGELYTGGIELEVRFRTSEVSGLVTDLRSVDDDALWKFGFADVANIVLPDADLSHLASWNTADSDSGQPTMAQLLYPVRIGSPGPTSVPATFAGLLIGTGLEAGMHATGTWSVGDAADDLSSYLAGAFGAERDPDQGTNQPNPASPEAVEAMVLLGGAKINEGVLDLTFDGERDFDVDGEVDSVEAGLADLLALKGQSHVSTGATHVDIARKQVSKIRTDLVALQGLSTPFPEVEAAKWMDFQTAIETNLFELNADSTLKRAYSTLDDGEALELIDGALQALTTPLTLGDALAPDSEGVFAGQSEADPADMLTQTTHQVTVLMKSTDFTRYGIWWLETSAKASEALAVHGAGDANGPGLFAYSLLAQTAYRGVDDPEYPGGASATYRGKTIALQSSARYSAAFEAIVRWNATAAIGGSMDVVFTDFTRLEHRDPLYLTAENVSAVNMAGEATEYSFVSEREVRELVFAGVPIDTDLAFDATLTGSPTTTVGPSVQITFDRRTDPALRIPSGDLAAGTLIKGFFVGKDVDAPYAIVGLWRMGYDVRTSTGQPVSVGDERVSLGDGTLFHGAFGGPVVP